MDLLLDVIDENNNVIGKELFSKIHEEHLLHRTTDVFVFKDDTFQELLLTKRSESVKAPGKLCVPGGHLELGQTFMEGARMELQEEVFHEQELPDSIVLEELFRLKISIPDENALAAVFRTVHPGPFNNQPLEVTDSFFMNVHEIKKDMKTDSDKYADFFIRFFEEYWKKYHNNI